MRLNAKAARSRGHPGAAWARVPVALVSAAGLVVVSGCGSSGSSTAAAYCSQRTSLQNSVKGLTSLNASAGISGLQSQASRVKSDADALASSAKSDFPSQTSALKSAVDSLETAIKALAASPSATNISNVTRDAENVVTSAKNFADASSSKCS